MHAPEGGELWSISYRGRVARLRHRKGLDYLPHLQRAPDEAFAALDLALDYGGSVLATHGAGSATAAA